MEITYAKHELKNINKFAKCKLIICIFYTSPVHLVLQLNDNGNSRFKETHTIRFKSNLKSYCIGILLDDVIDINPITMCNITLNMDGCHKILSIASLKMAGTNKSWVLVFLN